MSAPVWIDGPSVPAWQVLLGAAQRLSGTSMADLWSLGPDRARAFVVEGAGLTLDLTRQRIDSVVLSGLCQLADQVSLRERIGQMYRGEPINNTENRAVLHTALRRRGAPYADEVARERARMLDFVEGVRAGRIRGSSGEPFERVVNIGIGGSDLGPAMAVKALRQYSTGAPHVDFVSNVDGCRLADVVAEANPRRTLFIVCSKTFTTLETRSNAEAARAWVRAHLGDAALPAHFSAVSVNAPAMDAFGVHPDHRFMMWDWVGGRYSLWSSIGVSLAIAVGRTHFEQMLSGAAAMDEHFLASPWSVNLPALMGLVGVWNINFLKLPTLAVLPYDERLARFPAYLQQLEMESNGKSVRRDGSPVSCDTAPVVWGEPGNNAQHSFFQMLHQGTARAALDFLLPMISSCGNQPAQDLAVANCLAQAEAFAFGHSSAATHKQHDGGRPGSIVMFRQLDPASLGALVALYEHKVFVQSVVWGVNAFDQWGVELGKNLAESIAPLVAGRGRAEGASLRAALDCVQSLRGDQ